MRPAEFSSEQVIQAGQDLQAAGRNITGFALRQKVGGGNPTRFKQIWDEHCASQSVVNMEPVAELPVEVAEKVAAVTKTLTEQLASFAVELNDKAVKASERRVSEVVRTAGEQRTQAERELADAAQTVDDLEAQLDEALINAETVRAKLDEVQNARHAQAVELAQLRERLMLADQTAKTTSEQHTAELGQLRAELAEQKQNQQAALAERDQVRAELMKAQAKAESAEKDSSRMSDRIAKSEKTLETVRAKADAAREESANLRGQIEVLQNQLKSLAKSKE